MESDDDTFFSPTPEDSIPENPAKLKRLRKASRVPEEEQPPKVPVPFPVPAPTTDSSPPLSSGRIAESEEQEDLVSPPAGLDEEVVKEDDGLDPLFGERGQFTGCVAAELDWEVVGEGLEGVGGGIGVGEGVDGSGKKKSTKKRLDLEWGEEDSGEEKKRRKKKKKKIARDDGVDGDWTPVETTQSKRKTEKERKTYLEQLHAESQRLLRETRDASFKPAPLVQKPISSVLEKIRLRRLEMFKKFDISIGHDSPVDENGSISKDVHGLDTAYAKPYKKEHPEAVDLDKVSRDGDIPSNDVTEIPLSSNENVQHDEDVDSNSRNDHQTSVAAAQDSVLDLPVREESMHSEEQIEGSPENSTESLHDTRSEPYSNPLDDSSSDEEDYDKENDDPLKDKPAYVALYKTTGLVNTFVDDEAEEEDDSDHDIMRFQEKDEDDESENEGLNDIIATSFKEKPIDQERRDELHRKWLEQQDAADTDNVLQRIKKRGKQKETSILQDDDFAEDCGEDSDEGSLNNGILANKYQHKLKRPKQTIVHMFDDRDEGYVSSDEEETERRLSRQRLLKQANNNLSILAPEKDENSREIFSLVKKLNIAPDPKKRTKTATPSYGMLLMGENSSGSSKLSFLGRATSNSLPSSTKKGPSTLKSFIFGCDDSNSRSGVSASDNISDMNNKVDRPNKTASAKFSFSQSKLVDSKTKFADSTASEPSLFQILRGSSLQFDQQQKVTNKSSGAPNSGSQAAYQLTAFKLRNRAPRKLMKET